MTRLGCGEGVDILRNWGRGHSTYINIYVEHLFLYCETLDTVNIIFIKTLAVLCVKYSKFSHHDGTRCVRCGVWSEVTMHHFPMVLMKNLRASEVCAASDDFAGSVVCGRQFATKASHIPPRLVTHQICNEFCESHWWIFCVDSVPKFCNRLSIKGSSFWKLCDSIFDIWTGAVFPPAGSQHMAGISFL